MTVQQSRGRYEVVSDPVEGTSQPLFDPIAAGIGMVVSGHSHKPDIEEAGGVTYLYPGSAGPRRFRLPISVATV